MGNITPVTLTDSRDSKVSNNSLSDDFGRPKSTGSVEGEKNPGVDCLDLSVCPYLS
jgi:hypothetical protein